MKSSSHSIYLPKTLARGLFLSGILIFPTASIADSNVEVLSDNEASPVTIPSPPPPIQITTLDARPRLPKGTLCSSTAHLVSFETEAGLNRYDSYRNMHPILQTSLIVDFIADDAFFFVCSRDLASSSFNSSNNSNTLLDQLLADVKKHTRAVF